MFGFGSNCNALTAYVVKEDVKMDYFISVEAVTSADVDRHLLYEYLILS